jgi:hypothetical protein
MIKQYVKKPVIVNAVQYTGDNDDEVTTFFDSKNKTAMVNNHFKSVTMETNKGIMMAEIGDFIIKDFDGELYTCKNGVFENTYEEIQ